MRRFNSHFSRSVALDTLAQVAPSLTGAVADVADTTLTLGRQWRSLHEAAIRAEGARAAASGEVDAASALTDDALRRFVWAVVGGRPATVVRALSAQLDGVSPSEIRGFGPERKAVLVHRLLVSTEVRPELAGDASSRAALTGAVQALDAALALRREASQAEAGAHQAAASAQERYDQAYVDLVRVAEAVNRGPVAWAPKAERRWEPKAV